MQVNRAPRAAPPGSPTALRGRGRLPTDHLRHQHEGGSARRPRGPPPATSPLPGDRIRCAKDTGLDRFPLQGFAQNRIWCLIVALACDLLTFSQLLALTSTPARTWEPRTIRLRLMSIPAIITHHARRTVLRYKADHPFTGLLLTALSSFQALPAT
ncbi:transposase [Actinomyces sp. SKVG-SVH-4(1)]